MKQKILIVDDHTANRYVLESLFGGEGYEVISAIHGREALEFARKTLPDLVISDILMPVMDGYELCKHMKNDPELKNIPFVFYTATYTDQKDEDFALSLGADQFLLKPLETEALLEVVRSILSSPPAQYATIAGEAEFYHLHSDALYRKLEKKILDLERINQRLREERDERVLAEKQIQVLASAIEMSPVSLAIADEKGKIVYVNALYRQAHGSSFPGEAPPFLEGESFVRERRRLSESGQEIIETIQVFPVKGANGQQINTIVVMEDITRRKNLEERVLRAQKMEELGLMTSGVAHDFNNILSAILGFSDMALLRMEEGHPACQSINEVKQAAMRASRLTSQLLSFSRKSESRTEMLDLNALIKEFSGFLTQITPPEIHFLWDYSALPILLMGDRGQLEQVLMNLVINSRDAMPSGGRIAIRTFQQNTEDGPEAVLEIEDTGMGMDETTKRRAFETFFTTKKKGEGTGLGLSIVSAIVEAHGGRMDMESEPNQGTTFRIVLPLGG